VIFAIGEKQINVLAFQVDKEKSTPSHQLLPNQIIPDFSLGTVNEIHPLGPILDVVATLNGHHLFLALSRHSYEIASAEQSLSLCQDTPKDIPVLIRRNLNSRYCEPASFLLPTR
jgi:hypothetical protein